ncbi:DUF4279 domain-containing protein [Lentzea cavernae]|uniref:DUF4279 domain-containing protein n=1 Tax=Lentzea cavernae TaxID=2020703 RepID=A0ABQ3MTD4_9PSEU|nr:DUF4279 domain-containing protein [Lentzea cavernae]GHH60822.1 hypothetical protein GCM10017774_85850 [Lentzea cavernae]
MTERDQHEYKASLRVFSETLTLADLVASLGEPTRSYDVGDPVSPRRPDGPRRAVSHWALRSRAQPTSPLDEHLSELVVFVEAHSREIEALRDKAEIDVFCGVFAGDDAQGGFTLTADLMRRLAALGLDVGFDLY